MPASIDAVSGVNYGWALGESGYKGGMDANLLRLGLMSQIRVLDRDLTVAPGSPNDGDIYIPASGSTGVWAGMDDYIAVWRGNLSAWEFYAPEIGWVAYLVDEEKLTAYKAAGWSAGIAI